MTIVTLCIVGGIVVAASAAFLTCCVIGFYFQAKRRFLYDTLRFAPKDSLSPYEEEEKENYSG